MSFFSEQLARLQKSAQQQKRNRIDVEGAAYALVAEIKRCWGTNGGVRLGVANAVDFTVNQIGMLTDDLRGEFLVDIDFRSDHGYVWNPRFQVVATLTRGGVLMEVKDGPKHRVSAAQPASFHPLIAELEHAVDRWISALERSAQPQ